MMRLVLATAAVVLAATLAPALALGKGENGAISQAMIEGPGLADQISLPGGGGSGEAGGTGMQQLGQLTESAFFPAAFEPRVSTNYGQWADTRLREKPKGELGPRYTITYVMRGPNGTSGRILQDVYPYAKLIPVPYLVRGQVVTYMKPGQRAVGSKPTVGGWYVATTFLKDVLVAAGLPETPPSGDESSGRPWELIGAVGGIGIVLALGALLIRLHGQRRTVTA